MFAGSRLLDSLRRIDGRGYKAYKDLQGIYDFGKYGLSIDHVQGDPFTQPSFVNIRTAGAGFPSDLYCHRS